MKTLIILVALVAGLSAMVMPKQKSGVFTIEMKSTPSLRAGLIKAGKWQQVLANLHTKASSSQPFIDYQDNFYLVNVTTGTPPQQFNIVPDTGSSNYWLIDANKCTNQACQGYPNSGYTKHRFDSTKSTTFKSLGTSFSLQYGSGSCVGTLAVDVLSFAGLTYGSQTFGLASSIADVFGYQIMDGIMGLGWPALSDNKVVPPMQNLLSTLDKPLFTVWMDRITNPPSQGGNGGLITYGALDTINCDTTFNYVTLSSQTYWQFAVDSFSVGTYNVPKSQQVISDTGTSWLGGPPKLINYIVLATNAKYDALNQAYTVSCTATGLPDIVFTIGDITYNIPSTEYVLDMGLGNGDCVVTIFDMEFTGFGPQWILGDTFIRTYCNVYDIGNGQIGFSKAHHKSV